MKLVVCSHNLKSTALKNLANALTETLGYKVWRKQPTSLKATDYPVTFLPGINKVEQFASFHRESVPAPAYATSLEAAKGLKSKQIVVRSLIDSSEGRGITISTIGDLDIEAPLYTEYIPKKREFRVHVLDNKVIDTQEKRRRKSKEETKEFQVRNTANGYVFCRDGVVAPNDCHSVACAAVKSLGRTYGAVDIIYNEKQDKCYVLEVNSRPGMEGTTVKKYVEAIVAGLPADVRNPVAAPMVARTVRVARIRADGKRLITTKKGAKVWR